MLENIVLKLLDNWHWVVVLFFVGQFIKIGSNVFIKIYELKVMNKDTIRVAESSDSTVIEITSSSIKLDDVRRLKSENLIEYKKSS